MVRLVLFDIDGTLIRTGGAGVHAFTRTFTLEFGLMNATEGVSFAGRTDSSLVREIFTKHGIPATETNFRRFLDTYVFLLHHLLEQSQGAPCAGVPTFVRGLQTLPTPPVIGLLTGNVRLGAELKLRRFNLWDHFCCGAFGDDHEDRNCLAGVARQRGQDLLGTALDGHEILVIGDTPLDIACGKSIGAQVLAVGTGNFSPAALRAHQPTWAVQTLEELDPVAVCTA